MSESFTNRSLRYFSSLRVLLMTKFSRNSRNRRLQIRLVPTLISQWKNLCLHLRLNLHNSSRVFNQALTKGNRWWMVWTRSREIVLSISSSKSRWVWHSQPTQITRILVSITSNINNSFNSRFTKWLVPTNYQVFRTFNKDRSLLIQPQCNTSRDHTTFHSYHRTTTTTTLTLAILIL